MTDCLTAETLRTWAVLAVAAVAEHRTELDELNVFPVADSDTGTNLYLTLREGAEALAELSTDDPVEVGRAFARGALIGARGNSGVIVSQYLGALLRHLETGSMTGALQRATVAAYAAVGDPVEGTVLTVARAVGEGAGGAADDGVLAALEAGIDAGYRALSHTTAQLAPLREAGVLDAGGWGLLLVLDALGDALRGQHRLRSRPLPEVPEVADQHCGEHHAYGGGAFEVMFLVRARSRTDDGVAAALTAGLSQVGESVAVVGSDGLWQAHVHSDDPLAAVAAAAASGVLPTQIRVRHIARQSGVHGEHQPRLGLVAVTGSAGMTADLARAGAVVVLVRDGQAGPELGRAIDDTGARQVLLLAREGLLGTWPAREGVQTLDGLTEVQLAIGAATWATLTSVADEQFATVRETVSRVRTAVGDPQDAAGVVAAADGLLAQGCSLLTVLTPGADGTLEESLRAGAARRGAEVVILVGAAPEGQVLLGAE